MFNLEKFGLVASLILTLVLTGCGQESGQQNKSNSEEMNYTITGMEPGAGQTILNEQVIAEYENLKGWKQDTSSAGAMFAALDQAIQDEKPIMITAWSPHYKFAKWNLKFLEDPKGIFGAEEQGTTLVRNGLADEKPTAYTILDRIYFEIPAIEAGLLKSVEEELEFSVIAQQWVEENLETVEQWTEGVKTVDGTPLEIVTTPWDDSIFISNVAKIVLEQQGFVVELTPVDPAVVFKSIATGDADATLSPWLPTSHGPLYEEYEGQFEDLGPVFEGAKIGLAVPTYMEEDSLEDFEPAE
ncbi:glycine betaine ABC transporter substrate-binding protein [Ureibacillus acetophenoni]|uniref:Glycine betaine/proline transport system substrate-binding protein n=1 Tax=Ureibacillus acetophenoni TaxID=614649 RepID=A0A285UQY9_9BACL|nr:glycine betaine ABC transporter substrate-binding protein [Ureibacillus acetophenoni]SOC44117.1 glycine betaine/proline transport system substrate-binding protein [Ureibacillus acetophenoni]